MDKLLAAGSSPRVRGTSFWTSWYYATNRFIPACAGNMQVDGDAVKFLPSVHPRVCGEHLYDLQPCVACSVGSSPRVRGTCLGAEQSTGLRRFIPACAGNISSQFRPIPSLGGSSPRVRGTYLDRVLSRSSPRSAGNMARATALALARFIPACAGNIAYRQSASGRPPVHPRVCGEHDTDGPYWCGGRRFIPACAGNIIGT